MPDAFDILDQATRSRVPRVPFHVGGVVAGSVARAHLPALATFADALDLRDDQVRLAVEPAARNAALAHIHARLREQGLIVAWRDETFPLLDPDTLDTLAHFERAAARFWGTLTLGAHATGYVADGSGRPQALWIAQRSFTKATDPGCHDNLVGGGVPAGQTPDQALVREAWEEAGLQPAEAAQARPAGVLRLARDIPEGYQFEWLYSYDLALPPGREPANQDGEVHAFQCLAPEAALALACSGRMTVDAALVTLDFALRHRLVADESLATRFKPLRVIRRG